jgi:transcriptional regulator with XRE-family HTH domain
MGTTTTRSPVADQDAILSPRTSAGFNEWLRIQLKVRRMSQRQLAMRSGVDHSSISRLIRGDRVPSLGTAMKLAQSIDPGDHDGRDRWIATSISPIAAARVEYALRTDDQLSEADIRDVMLYYLGARRRRSGSPRRVTRIG